VVGNVTNVINHNVTQLLSGVEWVISDGNFGWKQASRLLSREWINNT